MDQIRSPDMMAATSKVLVSIWQPKDESTWLRWVLARERVVCWRKESSSGFWIVRSTEMELEEANRIVC